LFHSDAVQAVGKIEVDVDALKIDLMSLTAHKMYGPKGVGALYIRRKTPPIKLYPQLHGGGQEQGVRSGTLNVPGIVGFGKACELCQKLMPTESKRIRALRDRLHQQLSTELDDVYRNGHPERCVPGNLNLSFAYIESRALLTGLKGIALSAGSACNSDKVEVSYVLRAMGIKPELGYGAVRFGLGRYNTSAEVDTVIERVAEQVARLRALSPFYPEAMSDEQ